MNEAHAATRAVRRWGLAGLGLVLVAAAACGDEDPPDIACHYEERSTGCNNGTYGDWASHCADFPGWNYDDPSKSCLDAFTGSDDQCELSCCITVEYRNTTADRGKCP